MAKRGKAQGRRYSEAEKLTAVQIVQAAGGKLSNELLHQIRAALKAPTLDFKSVVLWLGTYAPRQNAPADAPATSTQTPAQSSAQVPTLDFQREPALTIVEHTFRQYAARANDKTAISETDGKDAAKVMVDMAKLQQLLQGFPTEIIEAASVLTEIAAFMRDNGINFTETQREFLAMIKAKKQEAEQYDAS